MPHNCKLNLLGGSTPAPTERVLLQLRDSQGVSWDLSLPTELAPVDRFPVGTALTVVLWREDVNILLSNWLLTVHDASGLALFVIDASQPDSVPVPESGLTFARGEMTCRYADRQCSSAQFATAVAGGGTQKSAPCVESVGGFIVTTFNEATKDTPVTCGGTPGFCDKPSRFQAGGLRQR